MPEKRLYIQVKQTEDGNADSESCFIVNLLLIGTNLVMILKQVNSSHDAGCYKYSPNPS